MVKRLYNERLFIVFTAIVLALFIINRNMYKNRFNGYMYTDALNYNQFYNIAESYRIQALYNTDEDSLKVIIAPEPKDCKWTITDSFKPYNRYGFNSPKIKLYNGLHNYKLNANKKNILDSIKMIIEFDSVSKNTAVLECNFPINDQELFSVARWTQLPKSISSHEIEQVRKILKEEVGVLPGDNTLVKITKITRFLNGKLHTHDGAPSDTIKKLTPLRQYQLACTTTDKVDCANYSDIYFLFANCAGVATRRIGVSGVINYVTISGHVFDESYIPEQRRWAFVDLMSKKVMVLNGLNRVLNTVDLLNINISKTYGKTRALVLDSLNNLDTVPYRLVRKSEIEYFKPTATFYAIWPDIKENMNFSESLDEYLGTKSHYGTYYANTMIIDNSKHYLKLYFYKVFVYSFFVWLVYLVYKLARWSGMIKRGKFFT